MSSPTIQFEVPSSTEPSLPNTAAVSTLPTTTEKKTFSIDLSLELERQLQLEPSPPQTPTTSNSTLPTRADLASQPNSDVLDPQILVHIISNLRKSVEDITKERDDLLKLLESNTTREASLQDTLQLMTEKATDYEEELSAAKKKTKEDEEAIALLRHKVEESRRGLMRLQTESRRQSIAPTSTDLSRAGLSNFSNPAASKRASFTPLTGRPNGHRRILSMSVSVDDHGPTAFHAYGGDMTPSPNPSESGVTLPQNSRRSFFGGKGSPPNHEAMLPASSAELESLKKEVDSLKKELLDTRAELAEAMEAKEASDMCVKTLRGFINENQVGATSDSSTSINASTKINNVELCSSTLKPTPVSTGWGFKLWKAEAPKPPVITTQAPSPTTSSSSQQTPVAPAPFSRKIGGFFSSRASISSQDNNPVSSNPRPLQSNAAMPTRSDSVSGCSVSFASDGSSVIEPTSPKHEYQGNVRVVVAPEGVEIITIDSRGDSEVPSRDKERREIVGGEMGLPVQ